MGFPYRKVTRLNDSEKKSSIRKTRGNDRENKNQNVGGPDIIERGGLRKRWRLHEADGKGIRNTLKIGERSERRVLRLAFLGDLWGAKPEPVFGGYRGRTLIGGSGRVKEETHRVQRGGGSQKIVRREPEESAGEAENKMARG